MSTREQAQARSPEGETRFRRRSPVRSDLDSALFAFAFLFFFEEPPYLCPFPFDSTRHQMGREHLLS